MENKKLKGWLPCFPGFYNSPIDIEELLSHEFEEMSDEESGIFFETYDFIKYANVIGKKSCNIIQEKLNDIGLEIEIKFEKVCSPKYYNYTTDSINVIYTLHENDIVTLGRLIGKHYNALRNEITRRYTSCSGFWSSHSSYIADWLEPKHEDYFLTSEHTFSALLEMIMELELICFYLQFELQECYFNINDFRVDKIDV